MRLPRSILALSLLCTAAHASDDVRTVPIAIEVAPDTVTASGRWVTDQALDAPLVGRANTAQIHCSRQEMACTEALASLITDADHPDVDGQLLLSILSDYTVTAWTDAEIVATSKKRVADVTLRIDLVGRSATRRHQETQARGDDSADPALIVEWQLR